MADAASQVLLGSGLTILSQPLMYVKVLIQVGYEPLPPTIGRNIFGRQVCQLPGLFCYAQHIASIDGKRGLFTGLTPRLCSGVLGTVVHGKVLQHYQDCDKGEELGPGNAQKEVSFCFDRVIKETTREMMARSAATLITHPFHVITLRSMVQFIGRESKYCGLCDSIATIYREEGILGFFAGLIPRLLGDIISLWLCNSLAYLVNTYALDSGVSTMNEMKSYSQAVTGFFASMLTYPFVLVSNLMAVNNCGLAGGCPPYSPIYTSWIDCWCMLQKEGNMSRGNSLFFRKVPFGKTYCCDLRMRQGGALEQLPAQLQQPCDLRQMPAPVSKKSAGFSGILLNLTSPSILTTLVHRLCSAVPQPLSCLQAASTGQPAADKAGTPQSLQTAQILLRAGQPLGQRTASALSPTVLHSELLNSRKSLPCIRTVFSQEKELLGIHFDRKEALLGAVGIPGTMEESGLEQEGHARHGMDRWM
ncbi:Mitochondrial carrier-2, partial [Galemys pyrenaicus]